ncbi:MAG: TIGR00341 family protein [Candidatus Helarchaeota archaeon]
MQGETDALIIFRVQDIKAPDIIESLNSIGVGSSYGIIDILEVKATLPPLEMLSKEKERISSKISVEEILKDISNNSEFSIDYIIFVILSAFTAGFGLISDNVLIVMASMVLAPLMGPILGLSFGIIIRDKILIKKAAKTEIFGFLISVVCGILIGLLYYSLNYFNNSMFPLPIKSQEILKRENVTILDFFIALIIGIATGFSLTGGKFYSSLVGLAVGVSLMPPIVNIGITLILGEFSISLGSFLICIVNILSINITAILIFKIKKIKKPSKTWIRWWRPPKLPEKKPKIEKVSETPQEQPKKSLEKKKFHVKSKKSKESKEIKKIKEEIRDELKKELKDEIKEEIKDEIKSGDT